MLLVAVLAWIAFRWIGLENAGAWAVASGLLHVIPYLGPGVTAAAVGMAAFMQFDSFSMAFLVCGASLAIATLVGTFVTTWMTGRIARMNAAAVFISLLFWGWLWGIWGMLLSIPIIVICKVVSEHVEELQPVAELLGRSPRAQIGGRLESARDDVLHRRDARHGDDLRVGLPHQRRHGQRRAILQDDRVRASRRPRHRPAELRQPRRNAGGDRRAEPALRRRRRGRQPLERADDVRRRDAGRRRDARHRATRRRVPAGKRGRLQRLVHRRRADRAASRCGCSGSMPKAISSRPESTRPTFRPAKPSTASRSSTA